MASNIPVIVQGNSFSLAIPLQIYYINGDQMDLEDYTPDPTDEVSVQLKGSRRNYTYTPTIDGNVANIDLTGNELADNYGVVVSVVKANGQRLRSFRTDQFFIVESSDDLTPADIIEGLEENVIYLNSSIFVAGEDGRGITSIVKTSTAGLVDTYTITYSDNTTSTFDVTNGAAGEDGATIASVEKTATVGKVDTYTITMTDGNTFDFEVTNGLDGVDLGLANIVDDLTTGGATNVLSAEQGKVIGDTLFPTEITVFDLTQLTVQNCSLGSNSWYYDGTNGKHIALPVQGGVKYAISITSGTADSGFYTFVTSAYNPPYTSGKAIPNVIGGAKRYSLAKNDSVELTAPVDAAYLIMCVLDGGGKTAVWDARSIVETDVIESLTDHCYTNNNNGGVIAEDENYEVEINKIRLKINNYGTSTSATRATMAVLTNSDVSGAISVTIPSGYSAGIQQAVTLSSSAQMSDTGWLQAGTHDLSGIMNSAAPYKIVNFKKVPDATFVASDKTALEQGFYISFQRTAQDGDRVNIIDETGEIKKKLYNATDPYSVDIYTKSAVDAMVLAKTSGDFYQGERIRLQSNKFSHKLFMALSNLNPYQARQGAAVYDKYFFQCYNTNPSIQVYDLTSGTLVQTITLTANPNCHANNASFGKFYDNSDPFPLLYISSEGERCVYVYRLTGTVGTLTIALIQTITLPSADDIGYYPNVATDGDNEILAVISYKGDSWQSAANDNKSKITYFALPSTASDVTLDIADAKASYEIPWTYAHQGACMFGGKIYLAWGNTSTALGGGLLAVNQGNIESSIDLSALGNYEPEGIGIYDGAIYISTQNNKMFKLEF